ncbi:MAG TPA: hypothetical protein VGY98_08500 [Verrucomicrobiae bacterium]|nr:hypothetical protein [Verrucomicrobiae bacterium]
MNNLRQLMVSWKLYADDNSTVFPPNPDYNSFPRWVSGDMSSTTAKIDPAKWSGIDATNSQLLVDSQFSVIAPYIKNPAIYRCPADRSTIGTLGTGRNEINRVRSYSMSQAVGPLENGQLTSSWGGGNHVAGNWLTDHTSDGNGNNQSAPGGFPFRVFYKESLIQGISPADLWVLIEEHANSINDAAFAVAMPSTPRDGVWIDIPSKRHNNGCEFSFADGHAEVHRWQAPGLIPNEVWQVDETANLGNGSDSFVDQDVYWLAHRTSCLAPGAVVPFIP